MCVAAVAQIYPLDQWRGTPGQGCIPCCDDGCILCSDDVVLVAPRGVRVLYGNGQNNVVMPCYGAVGMGRRLKLPPLLLPPFVLVLVVLRAVGPILSVAFPVGRSSVLSFVDGCGPGSSVVLQEEPLGDLLRGTVPLGDEAVSAKICGVPLSSAP